MIVPIPTFVAGSGLDPVTEHQQRERERKECEERSDFSLTKDAEQLSTKGHCAR